MPTGIRGFQKGHKQFLGTEITRFKTGNKLGIGGQNWRWSADKISYDGLHKWVRRWKGGPEFCEMCEKIGEKINGRWNIEWANIDHKYRRVLEDYIGLCHKCHDEYDANNNLKSFDKKSIKLDD